MATIFYQINQRTETLKLPVIIESWKKGLWYLARAPELDFISQGKTPEEARKNLLEVISIQFEEMKNMGTLEEYLQDRYRNNKKQYAYRWYDKGTVL